MENKVYIVEKCDNGEYLLLVQMQRQRSLC